jgi:putative NADH-flavin reductase
MSNISLLGGTGYAGQNIAREALKRRHTVTSYSRNLPDAPLEGVTYITADLLDPAVAERAFEGSDIVVAALSPRGETALSLRKIYANLIELASTHHVRLGVVGGAGSLEVSPGGALLVNTPNFPEVAIPEATVMTDVLADLRSSADPVDWFAVSPSALFSSRNPGTFTGTYRLGDDVLLVSDSGTSDISGEDFAHAFVNEIEVPAHRRARFTVGY